MIDFQHPRKIQVIEVILTDQYIRMYGSGMIYTIVEHQAINVIQQTLMG